MAADTPISSDELPGAAPLIDAIGADLAAPLLTLAAATERVGDVQLPPTLDAQQRHAVHVFCEGVGLASTSAGEGDARRITCRDLTFDGAAWAKSTLEALDAEHAAEATELDVALSSLTASQCATRGITVLGLRADDVDFSARGGRTRLRLEHGNGLMLPAHRLGVRSEVTVRGKGNVQLTGVMSRVTTHSLDVLTDADEEAMAALGVKGLRVDARPNASTLRCLRRACDDVATLQTKGDELREQLLGRPPPATRAADPPRWLNDALDASQRTAVQRALGAPPLLLVHGPPGTGKTTTLVEIVCQAAQSGQRVLCCGASNQAVDNLLERVVDVFESKAWRKHAGRKAKAPHLLRLGHPARLSPQVLRHSVEQRLGDADGADVVEDARNEARDLAKRSACSKPSRERTAARRDVRAVKAEVRRREDVLLKTLVASTRIIFATNAGAARREIRDARFDLVVVDEAAQALEASCWIPLLKGTRAILAGDHKQLPPTVKCDGAASELLSKTLFERLMEDKRPGSCAKRSILLETQYRMHGDICAWASQASYDGELKAAPSCITRDLYDDYLVGDKAIPPMVHVDTCGLGLEDDSSGLHEHGAHSVGNPGEAEVVVAHVEKLLKLGMGPSNICVIAPYHAQVTLLRTRLPPDVDCKTVDGYQGGERDAVVLSLTRSNPNKVVGFLADERRLNVAVTRARRHVCIVGDSETVRASPFIAELLDHVARVGDYVSAADYLPADAAVVAAPPPPVSPAVPPRPPAAPPVEVPPAEAPAAAVDDGAPTGSIPVTAAPTAPLPPASGELRVAFSGETVAVPFAPAWTVGELKRAVAEATGVEAARQKLVGAGKFVDDALPLAAAAPRLANGAKLILMVVPRPEDAVAPPPPPRGKNAAKKARRKVKAAAAAEPVAAPAPAPSTASQQLTGANSLLQQLARDRAARAAKAPRPAPAPAPKKKKKPPKKKAPPAGDDSDLDDDALLAAAIQANKKEKKREPAYKRWVDADGNIKGNTLHARQAERDRAALVAKLEKKKAGAAREKKQPAKK